MLINVQFLRFAAAMLVVIYHTGSHVLDAGAQRTGLFALGEAVGFAGVDVFFVISGFIMYYTTRELSGQQAGRQFLRRRFARIYSGYWPFFLAAWLLFAWIDPARLPDIDMLQSATLWPGRSLLIPISWTLTFEMYFYLVFGLLMLLVPAQRFRVLVVAFGVVVAWTGYAGFVRHAYDPGHLELMSLAEYYMASPYMAEFIAGSLLGHWLARHPAGAGWAWLLAGTSLFAVGGAVNTHYFGSAIEQGYSVMPRVALFGTASVMILAGLVRMEQQGKIAPVQFALVAGGASYAIYLSHILILALTRHLGLNQALSGLPDGVISGAFVGLALFILGFSILHYRLIERPLHHRFKRWLGIPAPAHR